MESFFNGMNNMGNSLSSNYKAATAGTDGGYESNSAENAGRMTDATGAADSKVTNAGIKKIETDAKNTVEAMSQDSDLKHLSNVASTAKGINY